MNAVESNEMMKMIEILSHDLKTPLTSVSFNIQTIKRMIESDSLHGPSALKEKVDAIDSKTRQMSGLIEHLMDIFKAEVSEIKMKKNLSHTHDFLHEMVDKLKGVHQFDVALEDHTSKDFCTVACDKERLFQVFHNVASNLKRLNEKDAVIKIATRSNGTHARFLIRDENLNLEDHHIQSLFDKFFHPKKDNKDKVKIGLALSRWIVEAHSGNIWVESNNDIGTVVIFEIPKTNVEDLKTAKL